MTLLIAVALQIVGHYALYNTSDRAELREDRVSRWLQQKKPFSKISGVIFTTLSFSLMALEQGFCAGILTAVVILMTVSSLTILISPLNTVKQQRAR